MFKICLISHSALIFRQGFVFIIDQSFLHLFPCFFNVCSQLLFFLWSRHSPNSHLLLHIFVNLFNEGHDINTSKLVFQFCYGLHWLCININSKKAFDFVSFLFCAFPFIATASLKQYPPFQTLPMLQFVTFFVLLYNARFGFFVCNTFVLFLVCDFIAFCRGAINIRFFFRHQSDTTLKLWHYIVTFKLSRIPFYKSAFKYAM